MNSREYQKGLLKEIDKKIDSLNELDHQGVLWWNEFKKFVKQYQPEIKEPMNFPALIQLLNTTFNREFRIVPDAVKKKYRARLREGYTKEDIFNAIKNCKSSEFHTNNDYQYCTPTYFSQQQTLEKWGAKKKEDDVADDTKAVN